MADADLKVIATADVSQLKKGMADATAAIAKTAAIAGKLDSTLARAGKGGQQATQALTNLGRVAQDAQFGFLGIANNLNPLLESFQRLQKESGGTKGALKALAGSLIGAGGIGFALSLAIPIVGFITSGFGAWTRGLKGNKTALDETARAAAKLKDEIANIKSVMDVIGESTASVQGNIAVVNILAKTILDTNKAYDERNRALKELKKINEAYFGDLTLESSKMELLTDLVNEYTAALVQQSIIKGFETQIGNITQAIFEQQKVVTAATKKVVASQKEIDKEFTEAAKQGPAQLARLQARFAAGVTDAALKTVKANAKLFDQEQILKGLNKQYTDLQAGITAAVEASLKFKPLTTGKGGQDKAVKDIETLNEVLAKMEARLVVLNKLEVTEGISKSLEKIRLFESTIEEIFTKFKLAAKDPVILKLQFRAADIKLTEFSKAILEGNPDLKQGIPFEFNAIPVFNKGGGQTLLTEILREQMLDALNKMNIKFDIWGNILTPFTSFDAVKKTFDAAEAELNAFRNSVVELTGGIAESFGQAIAAFTTGGKGLGQVFQGVLGLLGDYLVNLGKAAVKAAAAVIAFKKLTFAPQLGLIAGLAAIVAGTLLKNVKLPQGFATGGAVSGPGSSTSDSILARLSRGEYIIRADIVDRFGTAFFDRLNAGFMPPKMNTGGSVRGGSMGGQLITVQVEGRMRGRDIYFINQREGQTQSRNG